MNNDEKTINAIIRLMETDDSAPAPADAVKWSKNLFRSRAVEPKAPLIERIFAVLEMDLSPETAVFGERSAASGTERQMLFSAGDNSIDLRAARSGKNFRIAGQILGEGFEGGTITLESEEISVTASISDLSEFSIEALPAGMYRMTVDGRSKQMIIDGINLG